MIWEKLNSHIEKRPDKVAIQANDTAVTYREMARICRSLAAGLKNPREKKPFRILVRQKDPFSFLMHALSCWYAGAVPVLLQDRISDEDLNGIENILMPAGRCFQTVPLSAAGTTGTLHSAYKAFEPRQEGLIIGTSGTTAMPKLVALPMESVAINASVIGSELGFRPDDHIAVCTPLSYMYGFMGGCISSLWAGATVHLFDPTDPLTVLQSKIEKDAIGVLQGPPSWLRLFLAYWNGTPFSNVRLVTTGGEQMSSALRDKLNLAFPNARKQFLYGMTEAGPRLSNEPFESGGGIDGCVGRIYSHVEWKIIPSATDEAPPNTGRLSIRGPSIFLGYIGHSDVYEGLDSEGFFVTNDLVTCMEDGRLKFWARADRMFKSGGKLVNPAQVEEMLCRFPGVTYVICFKEPHPILGYVVAVKVFHEQNTTIDESEFSRFCKQLLLPHMVPNNVTFLANSLLDEQMISTMPLSESGKMRLN